MNLGRLTRLRVVRGEQLVRGAQHIGQVAAVSEASSASAEQVSASTQESSASAQQIAATATELATSGDELNRLVAQFKISAD